MIEVDINPTVKKWEIQSNSNLLERVSEVARLCGFKDVYTHFLPSTSNATASEDRSAYSINIGIDPTLFPIKFNSELRIALQTYFIGHELMHHKVKHDGAIGWFRHELLNKPNLLDTSDNGIEDSITMLCDDVKIDSILFDTAPVFILGFAAKHIPSYIIDGQAMEHIKNAEIKKIPKEQIRILLIRVMRRTVLARYLKDKDDLAKKNGADRVLIGRSYNDINNMLRQYYETLSIILKDKHTLLEELHTELYDTTTSKETDPDEVYDIIMDITS